MFYMKSKSRNLTASVAMWVYNMGRIALGIRIYINIFIFLKTSG